jgi:hypothetical protein
LRALELPIRNVSAARQRVNGKWQCKLGDGGSTLVPTVVVQRVATPNA